MKVSLSGLFRHIEAALRTSEHRYAYMLAYSFGEMVDNLRLVKSGDCSVEEFFKCYELKDGTSLACEVKAENYVCMREVDNDEID